LQKGIPSCLSEKKKLFGGCQVINLLLSLEWEIAWWPLGDVPLVVK